jgi:hypothetical protein
MLGKISSKLDDLDNLNKLYSWLPNSITIRPCKEVLEKKIHTINMIDDEWNLFEDYILYKVFNKDYQIIDNKKKVVDKINIEEWIFSESEFRYNLPSYSNHYVLWNSKNIFDLDIDDNIINSKIELFIENIIDTKNYSYNYAWYKNPKPTVNEFYHVQVFWIYNKIH